MEAVVSRMMTSCFSVLPENSVLTALIPDMLAVSHLTAINCSAARL